MGTDQSAEERRQVLGDDGELVKGDADVGLLVFAERRVGQPLQHLRQVLFVVRVRCIRRDANKKKTASITSSMAMAGRCGDGTVSFRNRRTVEMGRSFVDGCVDERRPRQRRRDNRGP